MTRAVQMVFLDIDGTIVHHGKLVDSAREAVVSLHHNGVPVALCTGRSLLNTRKLQNQLGIEHGVYFNGALAVTDDTIVQSSPLKSQLVHDILQFFQDEKLPIILHGTSNAVSPSKVPSAVQPLLDMHDFPLIGVMEQSEVSSDLSEDIYQVNAFMDSDWDNTVQTRFPDCLLYRWHESAVDLQKRDCDKSVGALKLLGKLGIDPQAALHIGDGGNDVGMFRSLGFSVAMGNAPLAVRQQAQHTTTNVDSHGVLHALRTLNVI